MNRVITHRYLWIPLLIYGIPNLLALAGTWWLDLLVVETAIGGLETQPVAVDGVVGALGSAFVGGCGGEFELRRFGRAAGGFGQLQHLATHVGSPEDILNQ